MTPDDVFNLATSLKESIEAYFTSKGVTLPDRRYIAPGAPAWDCEQLVIHTPRIFYGLPASESLGPVRQGATRSAEFDVGLIRCIPVLDDGGNAPSADELNASGQEILRDGWTLFLAVLTFARTCDDVSLGPLLSQGPEGEFAGWTQTVRVQL